MSKPVTIKIVDNEADTPLLVQAHGKCADRSDWAWVVRPRTGEGALVILNREQQAFMLTGDLAPAVPTALIKAKLAIARLEKLRDLSGASPGRAGLRGKWTGKMICGETGPMVEFRRRLNAYTEVVVSSVGRMWSASVETHENGRWYVDSSPLASRQAPTLDGGFSAAIDLGLQRVRASCTVRDAYHRDGVDPSAPVRSRGQRQPLPAAAPVESRLARLPLPSGFAPEPGAEGEGQRPKAPRSRKASPSPKASPPSKASPMPVASTPSKASPKNAAGLTEDKQLRITAALKSSLSDLASELRAGR